MPTDLRDFGPPTGNAAPPPPPELTLVPPSLLPPLPPLPSPSPPPDTAALPPISRAVASTAPYPFAFTGRAADYFRIWIVNLLLTLVTFGLWSPWAKVRKRRYFYGHTWGADANFEYHGNPVAILRGRLLAAAAFGVYWVLSNLKPDAAPWLLLVLVAGAPWIVARSLAFNAVNSSHRGIRFHFDGTARDVVAAIWPLVLWPVSLVLVGLSSDPTASPAAFGIAFAATYIVLMAAYPYSMARVRRLTVEKSRWGASPFVSALRTRKVYAIYGIALVLFVVVVAVLGAMTAGVMWLFRGDRAGPERVFAGAAMVVAFLIYAGLVVLLMSYTRARIANLVFNTAAIAGVAGFRSTLSARKLARLYAGNLVLILVTGGLLIPWAVIRVARYRVASIAVLPEGPFDDVAATVSRATGAAGEELGEMFGIDLAL